MKGEHGTPPRLGGQTLPRFGPNSEPYLWATEYPWLGLDAALISGKRVLTVAGGGDLPLFFLAAGAGSVHAVDVSQRACRVSELKQAAVRALDWVTFIAFFCSGLKPAESWLERLGIRRDFTAAERLAVYRRLAPGLSDVARRYWTPLLQAASGFDNPFAPLLRPTDFLCPNALPLLADQTRYESWRRAAAAGYRLDNDSLEACLASTRERFDLIYCSNLLDYQFSEALQATEAALPIPLRCLSERAEAALRPGGILVCYVFASAESAWLKALLAALGACHRRRPAVRTIPISCRSLRFSSTRLRHTLVLWRKPC